MLTVETKMRNLKEEAEARGIAVELLGDIGSGKVERVIMSSEGEESTGYLFVYPGAMIDKHGHPARISEEYAVIIGKVEVNGLVLEENGEAHRCFPEQTHYLKNLSKDISIVKFTKSIWV